MNTNLVHNGVSAGEKRHIYVCTYWNTTNERDDYDWIFTDNVKQQIKVYRFSLNMEKRDSFKNKIEENGKIEDKLGLSCAKLTSSWAELIEG